MARLCRESSLSDPGRAVHRAVRVAMRVERGTIPKGVESPSNAKVTVVARGAGLRTGAKALELPPVPYRNSGSASGGNVWRDGAGVSRGQSSRCRTGGQGR